MNDQSIIFTITGSERIYREYSLYKKELIDKGIKFLEYQNTNKNANGYISPRPLVPLMRLRFER